MTKDEFVKKYWFAAKNAGEKYKINPVVILAQGAVESAWGSSYSATARKNFFGITAFGSPNEYWNGAKSTSSSSGLSFRVYSSVQNSFYDFARLISSKYPEAAKASFDTDKYAHKIAYSEYISEKNGDSRPGYEKMIKEFSNWINGVDKKKIQDPDGSGV